MVLGAARGMETDTVCPDGLYSLVLDALRLRIFLGEEQCKFIGNRPAREYMDGARSTREFPADNRQVTRAGFGSSKSPNVIDSGEPANRSLGFRLLTRSCGGREWKARPLWGRTSVATQPMGPHPGDLALIVTPEARRPQGLAPVRRPLGARARSRWVLD
jgi:hypothetical protein